MWLLNNTLQEQNLNYLQGNLFNIKYIQLLAIGDQNIGKTTFLNKLCNQHINVSAYKINLVILVIIILILTLVILQDYIFELFAIEEYHQYSHPIYILLFIIPMAYKLCIKRKSLTKKKQIKSTTCCDIHIMQYSEQLEKQFDKMICFQFFDVTGYQSMRDYISAYVLKNMKAILYFFDVTNIKSFDNFNKWIQYIMQDSTKEIPLTPINIWKMPMILIGTKCDLLSKFELDKRIQEMKKILQDRFNCNPNINMCFITNMKNDINYLSIKAINDFLMIVANYYIMMKCQKLKSVDDLNITMTQKNINYENLIQQYYLNQDSFINLYNFDTKRLQLKMAFGIDKAKAFIRSINCQRKASN